LSCWLPGSPEVITLMVKGYYRTHSRLWTSVHPWTPSCFIYYVFGQEVQFPVFAYSNKHLTSIQDTSGGVALLGALDRCDSLVEWLQEWDSGIGQLDCIWNVMAHAQKPDFVFWRKEW